MMPTRYTQEALSGAHGEEAKRLAERRNARFFGLVASGLIGVVCLFAVTLVFFVWKSFA